MIGNEIIELRFALEFKVIKKKNRTYLKSSSSEITYTF